MTKMPTFVENFDTLTQFGVILSNLHTRFPVREYQTKAFSRFDYYLNNNFDGKQNKPLHLLYNMATGSGKTLVMAGLILYLYEKGYRNFLFFVNSNNIIQKTKDNFLNPQSSKYLFNHKIIIDGRELAIKETDTFESADDKNINIKFTTIQQLHIDLNTTKENSVTYEDFKDKKIVLIADEAHRLNAATKNNGDLCGTWEGTVVNILNQNLDNILLEFTATLDYHNVELANKYQDKVIFKYDLAQFRIDKYSKEINLFRSSYNEPERIVQALILNLYRQELATSNNINLKPVILFKAKKTIKESEQNKVNFHYHIDALSGEWVDYIRKTASVDIIQKAFRFFDSKNLTSSEIAQRIKTKFRFENCISANNDEEAEKNQILLNTLEDDNNPVRAVFAVQKLNEGWDVLNLFDIVRLYDGKNAGVGRTTLSEAQLIGRGARYFPFALEQGHDKFTRKYDDDPANDLKILEELYYHTQEDSQYISELKSALVESGIYDDEGELFKKQKTLKPGLNKTEQEVFNRINNIKSLADCGVSKRNFVYTLTSGMGKVTGIFNPEEDAITDDSKSRDIRLSTIPKNVIRFALSQNPFFYFDSLQRYFPNVGSLSNFMANADYLGGLEISFTGSTARLSAITHADYLLSVRGLLLTIESEIKYTAGSR